MRRSIGRSRSTRRKLKIKLIRRNKRNNKVASKIKKNKLKAEIRIVDINDHCLIEIFHFLGIYDLVNIASASTRFYPAACHVFEKTFSGEFISAYRMMSPTSTVNGGYPLDLLAIEKFGHLIKKLRVDTSTILRFSNQFEQYINKYCEKSVTDMVVAHADSNTFIQVKQKPFVAVKSVVFTKCCMSQFISDFNKWFPNAQSVEFLDTSDICMTGSFQCIEQHLPNVKHLGIHNSGLHRLCDGVYDGFNNVNLKASIALNPQLESLKLKHDTSDFDPRTHYDHCGIKITPTFLAYLGEKLPVLNSLDLLLSHLWEETDRVRRQVHFANLQNIKLIADSAYTFAQYEISTHLPARIVLASSYGLNYNCAIFLSKNKNWREIIFYGEWESYQCFEIVKTSLVSFSLLNCVEINIAGLEWKQKEVLALLTECQHLIKIKIGFSVLPWREQVEWAQHDPLRTKDERHMFKTMCDCLLRNWKSFRASSNLSASVINDEFRKMEMWLSELGTNVENDFCVFFCEGDETKVLKNKLFETLDVLGNCFLEIYRQAFRDQRVASLWNSIYTTEGLKGTRTYCAIYEKKDV